MSTIEIRPSVPSSELAHAVSAVDVARAYGRGVGVVHALQGVSVEIARGELTAVLGGAGSGKSTLMHVLAGVERPTSGDVEIAGTPIRGLKPARLRRLRREHVGFVYQFFNVQPLLTVEENILQPFAATSAEPDAAWIAELIELTGVDGSLSTRSSLLSAADQQRTAIARALACRPTMLFADEPAGTVDPRARDEVVDVLRRAVTDYGQTVVMATDDPCAAAIADRILIIADGRIVDDLRPSSPAETVRALRVAIQSF
jgi:putative ABC transport system ATP-binding protein